MFTVFSIRKFVKNVKFVLFSVTFGSQCITEKTLTYLLLASLAKGEMWFILSGKAKKNEPFSLLFARAKRIRRGF